MIATDELTLLICESPVAASLGVPLKSYSRLQIELFLRKQYLVVQVR